MRLLISLTLKGVFAIAAIFAALGIVSLPGILIAYLADSNEPLKDGVGYTALVIAGILIFAIFGFILLASDEEKDKLFDG